MTLYLCTLSTNDNNLFTLLSSTIIMLSFVRWSSAWVGQQWHEASDCLQPECDEHQVREVVLLLYLFLWVGVFVFIYNKIFTTKCTYDTPIYQNNVLTMCIKSFSIILSLSSCPRDHSIEIINGNYGRFTITLCNNKVILFVQKVQLAQGSQNWSVNCYPESAMT